MKKVKKILVIIQRSNGDVFLSSNLICSLFEYFDSPKIDLLINDDTHSIASLLPHINLIHQFSYSEKKNQRWAQEKKLFNRTKTNTSSFVEHTKVIILNFLKELGKLTL